MRRRIVAEIVAAAGERAEREEHAWRALHFIGATWLDVESGGRALFGSWFRDYVHGDGLQTSLRFLRFFEGRDRVCLLRHVLENDGRLRPNGEAMAFANSGARCFGVWSIWWDESDARDVVQQWCEANERSGALADANVWRRFLSGFAWSLQNEVHRVAPGPRSNRAVARFVPLLSLAWSAWSRVVDDANEGDIAVGWSVTRPLSRRYARRVMPPEGEWSVSLRSLLPRVIAEGGRNDIAALQQVDWSCIDSETLGMAAEAAIGRADREIATRPPGDWIIESFIDTLGGIGTTATLAQAHAHRVLACLHRLGRSVTQATTAAAIVERNLRERGL